MQICYIHGFNSGPSTRSGQKLRECFPGVHVKVLSYDSAWSCHKIQQTLEANMKKVAGPIILVGSSLGGYHAARLAGKLGLPSVLVNPCNNPPKSLRQFLGENVSYEDAHRWNFTKEVLESYEPLDLGRLGRLPELVVIGLRDELLNPEENTRFWEGHVRMAFTDDSHSIESFEPVKDEMLKMLNRGSK